MPSILESLTKVLGQGGTLAKLGSVMDGDADKASEGVAAAGPALLGALAENAGTDEGAEPVAELVDSVGPSILDDVEGFVDSGETDVGKGVLDALFGDDRQGLLSGLSSEGSVTSSGYRKLLPVLAPLVLGAVAKRKEEDDLDVEGLASTLAAERSTLEDDGNLGEWFGRTLAGGGAITALSGVAVMARNRIGGTADKVGDVAEGAADAIGDAVEGVTDKVGDMVGSLRGRGDDDDDDGAAAGGDTKRRRLGWFWWALGAVLLVLLLAWLLSRGSDDDVVDSASPTTAVATTTSEADQGTAADGDGADDDAAVDDTADDDAAADDATVLAAVEVAIADAGLGDSVTAAVSGGVVTLSGAVGADVDLASLLATVGEIEGVGDVTDEITVDDADSGDAETGGADADLAASVSAALADAGFGDSVSVAVSGGVVTLTGSVGSDADVEAVAAAVAAVEGVAEVANEVTTDAGSTGDSAASGTSLNEELGLAPITFAYRSAVITAEGEGVLAEVVAYLEANDVGLVIEGHTDNDGTIAENVALGQRRADAVSAFLEGAGIDGSRLEAVGIGETEPKVDNDTADGKAENRRIELVVAG